MRTFLRVLLLAGGLLLLLSALVVSAEPAQDMPNLPEIPRGDCAFIPSVQTDGVPLSQSGTKCLKQDAISYESINSIKCNAVIQTSDANGHPVISQKYAKTVYTLYQIEKAAG